MPFTWHRETQPRWDDDKQQLFGDAELAAVGLARPVPEMPMADEWWRLVDDRGQVVGYGWLDTEWGDARISFLVAPQARGSGAGTFIVDRLEDEARARGVNYIYNTVPTTHPDRAWMTQWLAMHGFYPLGHGDLRRQVRSLPG